MNVVYVVFKNCPKMYEKEEKNETAKNRPRSLDAPVAASV